MSSDFQEPDKKDLTGIFTVKPLEPSPTDQKNSGDDLNREQPFEKIDSFEPITELGMMDHPVTETFSGLPHPTQDLTNVAEAPAAVELGFQALEEATQVEPLDEIREYSENAKNLSTEAEINYPFHFFAEGQFGYYERDKLLRFITENAVGITSAEIDLQIQAGRILIPRMSEYAGIKLVQELRDSPLILKLVPSERDSDEVFEHGISNQIQYDVQSEKVSTRQNQMIVIDPKTPDRTGYHEIGQLQASQYLKAEMIEAEKSELFQEVLARMTESLKNKARIKGADAITQPVTQVLNLRLPSQYQVVLTTSLLKRKLNA